MRAAIAVVKIFFFYTDGERFVCPMPELVWDRAEASHVREVGVDPPSLFCGVPGEEW